MSNGGFMKLFVKERTEIKTKVLMDTLLMENNDFDYQTGKSYPNVVYNNITYDINNITGVHKCPNNTQYVYGDIYEHTNIVYKTFDIDNKKICLYTNVNHSNDLYYANNCNIDDILLEISSRWHCMHLSLHEQSLSVDMIATKNSKDECNLSNLKEIMNIISYVGDKLQIESYSLIDGASTPDGINISLINLTKGKYPSIYNKYGFKYTDENAELFLSNCKNTNFEDIMEEISVFNCMHETTNEKQIKTHKLVTFTHDDTMITKIESNAFSVWKKINEDIYNIINKGNIDNDNRDIEKFGYKKLYDIIQKINNPNYGTLYITRNWILLHKLILFAKNCRYFIKCPILTCNKIIL